MDETTATSEMRVATLNLWGRRGEWNERRRVLVEGFRAVLTTTDPALWGTSTVWGSGARKDAEAA